ncbi:MAG: hypothetical protein CSA83_02930 [Actinomycetales bacterium]|nr:MAG: hypothetical protein CSA83_02930 [Actinomycetales bacterium]
MDSELQILATSWEGEAQMAYHQAKAQWNQSMADLEELLRAVSRGVESSNGAYQQMDNANASYFR